MNEENKPKITKKPKEGVASVANAEVGAGKIEVNKEAKRKRWQKLAILLSVVGVLFIVAGVVIFYFVTPDIKGAPTNLRVENYDGELYLVADYQEEYNYQFVVEVLIGDEYVEVGEAINSDTNTLNLSEQAVLLNAGSEFRFKVAYANENGANGEFSDYLNWTKVTPLDKIEASVNDNVISWNSVNFAEGYLLKITYPDGSQDDVDVGNALSYSLSGTGTYQVYVIAVGGEGFYSSTSQCLTINI